MNIQNMLIPVKNVISTLHSRVYTESTLEHICDLEYTDASQDHVNENTNGHRICIDIYKPI